MKTSWSMMVIFDKEESRQRAVDVCDHLIKRFWNDCGFDVCWWSCAELKGYGKRGETLAKAVEADLLVVALHAEAEPTTLLGDWLEDFVKLRGEREGVLINLVEEGSNPHSSLRQAAHRAGMDYLTHEPDKIGGAVPDSIESVTARAEQITSVLDEILRTQPLPSLHVTTHQ
jgi:hypothetical protein